MNDNDIMGLHREAMALMHKAKEMQEAGNSDKAKDFFSSASLQELSAAQLIEAKPDSEPRRGIFFLSAASLAWQAGDLPLAERIVALGLSGYPTPSVKSDLYSLLDDIKFDVAANTRSSQLATSDMEIRLYGKGVRTGYVSPAHLTKRLNAVKTLIQTASARLLPFKTRGDSREKLFSDHGYTMEMGFAPAGSFGVTVRVSKLDPQLSLVSPDPQDILNGIVYDIELIRDSKIDAIEKKYTDEKEITTLFANIKELFPDGKKIETVGIFTDSKRLTVKTSKIKLREALSEHYQDKYSGDGEDFVNILRGELEVADRGKRQLKFKSESGELVSVTVKEGLEDFVRQYFGELVEIEVQKPKRGKNLLLIGIESASE